MGDYIMDLIDAVSETLIKAILGKEAERELNDGEIFIAESEYDKEEYIVRALVKRLFAERRINEAENALFEALENSPTKNIFLLAAEFYKDVAKLSDRELRQADYSREEIKEALEDIKKIFEEKK